MKMFVVLALAAFAAAEPEADPQLLLGGIHGVHSSYTPYSHVAPVATYASPLWRNMIPAVQSVIPAVVPAVKNVVSLSSEVKPVISTPVVSSYSHGIIKPMTYGAQFPITTYGAQYPMTYGAQYPMTYGVQHPLTYGAQYPLTHGVFAEPTKVVTNYINKDHYTAEATPLGKALGVPSYTAKNGEVVHEVQKREAEADPALIYSGLTHAGINTAYTGGVMSPYTGLTHAAVKSVVPMTYGAQYPLTYGAQFPLTTAGEISPYTGLTHAAVKSVVPTTYGAQYPLTYGAQYPMTYGAQFPMTYGVQFPMTHGVITEPTEVVTNYINKDHYTAEATPLGKALGVPSYTAKNGEVVHEVQKREAEADPALFYSGLTHAGINTAYTAGVMSPYTGLNTPYTHAAPINTYTSPMWRNVIPAVRSLVPAVKTVVSEIKSVGSTPVISSYTHQITGVHTPYTHVVPTLKSLVPAVKSVVSTPLVSAYTGLTHTPVYKTQDHGVIATHAGLVHSSHAGLCLNNEGVQVAC